ncbi:MAG TPA: hypothetical protein VF552_12025 [Allosphingosinicella sp.]
MEAGARLGNRECESALRELDELAAEQRADEALRSGQHEIALRELLVLADRGSVYALLALGYMCETGAAGTPDMAAARSYYERAADAGSASACFELGRVLRAEGEETKARVMLQAGAERGDMSCMSRLGQMLMEGRGGPADRVSGRAWLEKAAAQGHVFARRTLLGLEARDASSMFEKLSVKMKILSLARQAAGEMLKDPESDKLR